MSYSQEQAEAYARDQLARLAKSRKSQERMLYATALKLGIKEVVSELGQKGGAIHRRFQEVGRYSLSIDDLRRVIHGMRNTLESKKAEELRHSFAWTPTEAPRIRGASSFTCQVNEMRVI